VPAAIVLAPVMAVIGALVAWRMGRPVLFTQVRPGVHERPFTMHKFRTMRAARDAEGRDLPDAARLTPLGRTLRTWSLDELPELFDVIRGDMSLVGPRPLFTHYLPYYTEQERARALVLPGITGWAQVNGRNKVPWDRRLAMDVWYVEHRSLGLDLRILGRTIGQVVGRNDVEPDTNLIEPALSWERRDAARATGVEGDLG